MMIARATVQCGALSVHHRKNTVSLRHCSFGGRENQLSDLSHHHSTISFSNPGWLCTQVSARKFNSTTRLTPVAKSSGKDDENVMDQQPVIREYREADDELIVGGKKVDAEQQQEQAASGGGGEYVEVRPCFFCASLSLSLRACVRDIDILNVVDSESRDV